METKYKGLTQQEVEESRRLNGENILTPPPHTPLWKLFLEKFEDPIIRILLVAWVLAMIIAGIECWGPEGRGFSIFLEPLGIFFAIMLATGVGFAFEMKADRAFCVLNKMSDDALVKVIRDGVITQIMKREVVVGDIVILETGDEIPADGTLLEAVSLQVNESTLTGEPIANKTTHEEFFDKEATYPSNVVMRGTTIADGHGIMRTDFVGDATGYGKVYTGSQIESGIKTPLQIQLSGLAKVINRAGYTAAGFTFLALLIKLIISADDFSTLTLISHILNSFMVAVTLIVVSVPEGLPMSVTLSLALSMNRMLKTNNLVRKMHACETMGAATVICTDKTGTLTQNLMQVSNANFYGMKGTLSDDSRVANLIREGIAVNSTAFLDFSNPDKIQTLGNPTEAALLLWLNEQGIDYLKLRHGAEVLSQVTFSTERKFMSTTVLSSLFSRKVTYKKGAPEIVLNQCSSVLTADGMKSVDETRSTIEAQLLNYQNEGMRTLGFSYEFVDEPGFVFLGIVAISDPVRYDVPQAVQKCLSAGIDVKIVTGDTSATTREIARQIGIWTDNDTERNIISGSDFAALTDDEALNRIDDLKIMCRARPQDKQRLVQLLQERGAVVAVTGDGTNDAPALKAAQVGLSMGDGTAVAKEASDITILDNSFSSIVRAVMWGRSLYQNIQKFLLYQLTINVAACLIVLIGSLIGTESPLTITQMLWVNLIMDTFAAGALASLPPNENVMKDKPRRSGPNGDFIITKNMRRSIFGVGGFFVVILFALLLSFHVDEGLSPHDLSFFFTFFVMLQFWNLFNAKTFSTNSSTFSDLKESKGFLFVAAVIIIGQVLIITFGGKMFNVVPLPLHDWVVIIVSTSFILWLGELSRFGRSLIKKVFK